MQVQYDGGNYYGFASQAGECENTIEKHVFDALLKLRLIESRQVGGTLVVRVLLIMITVVDVK